MSLGTFVSLCLGLVRDVLVAYFFGTSHMLEAFVVAFRLPNLFRSILGEGFSDAIAVPVLAEYAKDRRRLFEVSRRMIFSTGTILLVLTIVGMVFCRYFVTMLAPGFISQPDKFEMTVSFTRITFLYLFLIGLSINLCTVLYSLKKFFVPAINPIFLNLAFIIVVPFFFGSFNNYILVAAVVVGGFLQIVMPVIALRREGFSFKFSARGSWNDEAIRKMVKLFPPRLVSSVVYQLNIWVDTMLSSFTSIVGDGAICAIDFANRFIHVPLALVAVPISRVVVVDLSAYHGDKNYQDFKKMLVFSFQQIVFLVTPLCLALMFFSEGIIDVVFHRGGFNDYSSQITSTALFYYSFGLFSFCAIKLFLSAFYALKDTLTPAKTTAICLLVNALCSVILMFPLKIGGVALGTSISAVVNVFMLYRILVKKIGAIDWQDTLSQAWRVLSAGLLSMTMARILWQVLLANKYIKLGAAISAAVPLFIGIGLILNVRQCVYLKQKILVRYAKR